MISKNILSRFRAALCLLAIGLTSTNCFSDNHLEDKIKAAFIFNFIKFTEWPNDQQLQSYNVCAKKDASIHSELKYMHGKRIRGIPVVLKDISKSNYLENCQIVYFSKHDGNHTSKTLNTLQGKPVLTVGDSNAFTNNGGIIQFFMENNRIRFQINTSIYNNSQLVISSKLLNLSRKNTSTEVAGK